MTGTTVHLGEQLVERNWAAAAIAGGGGAFFLGSILGRAIIEISARRKIRRGATSTLTLEAALLAGIVQLGTGWVGQGSSGGRPLALLCLLLGVLAAAMGTQTATLTRVGPLTVHTTFVTGMLNKLAQLVASLLFRSYDLYRPSAGVSDAQLRCERRRELHQAAFILAVWILYLTGGVCGTWLPFRWQLNSVYVPCGLVLLAIAVDQVRPLSLEEEQETPQG